VRRFGDGILEGWVMDIGPGKGVLWVVVVVTQLTEIAPKHDIKM
jgi:hypothetical protein